MERRTFVPTTFLGEPRPEVSIVVENYLQAIYKLHERGEKVSPSRLAEALQVSIPTVVGTLQRLVKQGMVKVNDSRIIALTERGLGMAESVVRRHRLAECMLVELLKVEWHRAHEEAHRLEHAISPYVEERLAQVLGYPTRCPFGHPIPGYGEEEKTIPVYPLSEAREGDTVMVDRVPEEDQRLLRFFEESGIRPGAMLTLQEAANYKGTLTLRTGEKEVVLGIPIATLVLVRTPKRNA